MGKTLEAGKQFMWRLMMTLVGSANGSPIVQTFSCDCTPIRLPHKITTSVSQHKRSRQAMKTTELLVMASFAPALMAMAASSAGLLSRSL